MAGTHNGNFVRGPNLALRASRDFKKLPSRAAAVQGLAVEAPGSEDIVRDRS
jgi:hypothetical protein